MQQYLINRDTELNTIYLAKVLEWFQTEQLPELKKRRDYYKGKQKILFKKASDVGKPCNKIVVNYCHSIVQNYLGYMTGIPISYDNDAFGDVLDVLRYNDVENTDVLLLKNALIYGIAYQINYVDEEGKQRFKVLDSEGCVPIYNNDLENELRYVVRFYREDLLDTSTENYIVEVYGGPTNKRYRSTPGFNSFMLIDEWPNFYIQCPITVFDLNDDNECVFGQVLTLQDSYNELLSAEVDDFQAFCDSYLVLKGVTADEEDLTNMKKNRVLMIDADNTAEYLTKNISDTQIQNMLKNINDQIHTIAASPDFNDEKFFAQSGVALRYKLVGFENKASAIEKQMLKALQRRIELICTINSLTDSEASWRDAEIKFTRNLPTDLTDTVNMVNSLRGLVSDRTLLTLLPFIQDPDKELEEVNAQKEANMELYQISGNQFNNEEDTEDEQ